LRLQTSTSEATSYPKFKANKEETEHKHAQGEGGHHH
jgi:hypothetical protein